MIKCLVSVTENKFHRNLAVGSGAWGWQLGQEVRENSLMAKGGPDLILKDRNQVIRKLLAKSR